MPVKLPKYLLLTDPFGSMQARIVFLCTQWPYQLYEIGEMPEVSQPVTVNGTTYHIRQIGIVDNVLETLDYPLILSPDTLQDATRWYHYSRFHGDAED